MATSTGKNFYLKRGDNAITFGAETICTDMPHGGNGDGFICKVGGDYRARYGVIINSGEAAITQYSNFERYRVVFRRRQCPQWPPPSSCPR